MRLMRVWALLTAGLGLTACFSAPVEKPDTVVMQQTSVRVEQSIKNQVDMVFLVDNSLSMRAKQDELHARFPELIKVLDDFGQKGNPASYHIGVITSDLGAGPSTISTNCRPGGQGGRFQALGAAAPAGCTAPLGKAYIEYNQLQKAPNGNPMSNLPGDGSVDDLAHTFTCMSSVGDGGCGFEHQLEAVYRAIHDPTLAENKDFFRPDALLVIVFVTDEDDCSADPKTDLFAAPDNSAQYGHQDSYRCTHFGIMHNDPPELMPFGDSGGTVTKPRSATVDIGQKLFPIQRYIDYFHTARAAGGAKDNPDDVIMVGISAPAEPVSSVLAVKGSTNPLNICGAASATCVPQLQHSCTNDNNPLFYGDPAVRLNAVIGSLASDHRQLTSICDTSYQSALQGVGELIHNNIGPGCISSPFKTETVPPIGDSPDCTVTDITPVGAEAITTAVPSCKDSGGAQPCWQLVIRDVPIANRKACPPTCQHPGDPAQRFGIEILRATPAPSGTHAEVACATVAIPARDNGDKDNPLGCAL